jgi:hypothetical protein
MNTNQLIQHATVVTKQHSKTLVALEVAITEDPILENLLEYEKAQHQMALARLEPLHVVVPVYLAWFTIDEFPPLIMQRIRYAIEALRLLVRRSENQPDTLLELLYRPQMVCEYRHIRPDFGEVYLRSNAKTSVIVHELGHWLEESVQAVKLAALHHVVARVTREEPRPLGLHYHRSEYTQPDAFLDPYIGKCKPDGSRMYTELISTGLEWLYRDPIRLCRLDPDSAEFLLNLLETL